MRRAAVGLARQGLQDRRKSSKAALAGQEQRERGTEEGAERGPDQATRLGPQQRWEAQECYLWNRAEVQVGGEEPRRGPQGARGWA